MSNILIANNISQTKDNEYLYNLLQILNQNKEFKFEYGIQKFWSQDLSFDFIIINWQEALLGMPPNIEDNELEKVIFQWKYWKNKGTRLIIIRHDEYPHIIRSNNGKKLYDQTNILADGIIHLGEYSLNNFKAKYPQAFNYQKHIVIHHPLYKSFNLEKTQKEARKELQIPPQSLMLFIPGSIRHISEMDIAHQIMKKIDYPGKQLFFMRNIIKPPRIRYIHKYISYKIKLMQFQKEYDFILNNGFLDHGTLSLYLVASDIVLIPRSNVLNSGNVFLGAQFGKIIIGPNCGNINEQLVYLNQIIFDENSLTKSLKNINKQITERLENKNFANSIKGKIQKFCDEKEILENFNKLIISLSS